MTPRHCSLKVTVDVSVRGISTSTLSIQSSQSLLLCGKELAPKAWILSHAAKHYDIYLDYKGFQGPCYTAVYWKISPLFVAFCQRGLQFSVPVKALTSEQCRCMSHVSCYQVSQSFLLNRKKHEIVLGRTLQSLWCTKGSLPRSSEMSCGVSFKYRIWIRIRITLSHQGCLLQVLKHQNCLRRLYNFSFVIVGYILCRRFFFLSLIFKSTKGFLYLNPGLNSTWWESKWFQKIWQGVLLAYSRCLWLLWKLKFVFSLN